MSLERLMKNEFKSRTGRNGKLSHELMEYLDAIYLYTHNEVYYTIVTPFYSCCMNLSTDSRGPLLLHLWVHAAVATVPPARIQQEGGDASVVQCAV